MESSRIDQDPIESLPEIIWVVRSGERGAFVRSFLEDKIIGIGWAEVGEILPSDSDGDIHARIWDTYPYVTQGTHVAYSSQVIRFHRHMEIGDAVATYNSEERLYHVGVIRSNARYCEPSEKYPDFPGFVRDVDWQYSASRDTLSQGTRNSLGSALTVFRPSFEASTELRKKCLGDAQVSQNVNIAPETANPEASLFLEDFTAEAEEAISDRIANLTWQQLQELVAGILRAMGYRTKVSDPGPDRGVDVFASPDGLGLQEPRIFVQVKHRRGSASATEIRSFLGGRSAGDRCLYVSTGGYTREAHYEAERSTIPLNLIAMPDLIQLLSTHYEELDSETRALVPMKRIYVPIDV